MRRGLERGLVLVQALIGRGAQLRQRHIDHLVSRPSAGHRCPGRGAKLPSGLVQRGPGGRICSLRRRRPPHRCSPRNRASVPGRRPRRKRRGCSVAIEGDRAAEIADGDLDEGARRMLEIGPCRRRAPPGSRARGRWPRPCGRPSGAKSRWTSSNTAPVATPAVAAWILAPVLDRLVVEQRALDVADQHLAVVALHGAQPGRRDRGQRGERSMQPAPCCGPGPRRSDRRFSYRSRECRPGSPSPDGRRIRHRSSAFTKLSKDCVCADAGCALRRMVAAIPAVASVFAIIGRFLWCFLCLLYSMADMLLSSLPEFRIISTECILRRG